jgi:fructose-1,6-bisphosphatase/inositol monophosphatase family enzyme
MKHKRRDQGNPDLGLIDQVGTLHAVDGAIMIARVALGELDAYVDSYIGQPAYELPAIELVRRAGGIVTDESGAELTHERILTVMHSDPASRIKIIAAANRDIHDQIMASRARRP